MKRLLSLVPILTGMLLLFYTGTAFAMEPAYITIGFSNGSESTVEIMITDTETQTTETFTIPSDGTVDRTWMITEPGVKELLVENTDPETTDSAYYVWIYSEVDDDGALQTYAVSQIAGTDEKAGELVFGVSNEPEEPTDPKEQPTEPAEEEPTEPEEQPTKPAEEKEPAEPEKPTRPAQQPTEPTEPEEPTEPTETKKETKPDEPSSDKPKEKENYKTGDSAKPVLWIGISLGFVVLVLCLLTVLLRRRKNEDGDKE